MKIILNSYEEFRFMINMKFDLIEQLIIEVRKTSRVLFFKMVSWCNLQVFKTFHCVYHNLKFLVRTNWQY